LIQGHANHYLPFLKSVLTPARLQHSEGVMRVMGELAEIYVLNRTQAMMAGLLHDAARDLEPVRQLELAEEANIKFFHPCEQHPVYLHAKVGTYLISQQLCITDRLILSAISAHSFVGDGDSFDTPFSWCLRFADILAPVKEWKGMKKLESFVRAARMEEAALLQCGWLIEHFQETGVPVHPNLRKHFQTLSAKLEVSDMFFERW
jgi:HD superfamily phosphohydrolase YqeK